LLSVSFVSSLTPERRNSGAIRDGRSRGNEYAAAKSVERSVFYAAWVVTNTVERRLSELIIKKFDSDNRKFK
jgi:hypothetical protein